MKDFWTRSRAHDKVVGIVGLIASAAFAVILISESVRDPFRLVPWIAGTAASVWFLVRGFTRP